jgi:hypothetical protein
MAVAFENDVAIYVQMTPLIVLMFTGERGVRGFIRFRIIIGFKYRLQCSVMCCGLSSRDLDNRKMKYKYSNL